MKASKVYQNAEAAFGHRHQEDLLVEELAEFIKARNKLLRTQAGNKSFSGGATDLRAEDYPKLFDQLLEEYVDCQIMFEQFRRFLVDAGVKPVDIRFMKSKKLLKLELSIP